jgi:hypothetical protein
MRCGVMLAAALALCGSARGERAVEDEEELELRRTLEEVFQSYKVIGAAEWELHNTTLVEMRAEDAIDLIESQGSSAAAVADRYRGAVVFIPMSVARLLPLGPLRCAVSPTIVLSCDTWYSATISE